MNDNSIEMRVLRTSLETISVHYGSAMLDALSNVLPGPDFHITVVISAVEPEKVQTLLVNSICMNQRDKEQLLSEALANAVKLSTK